jgi:hypothetical protein
MALETSTTAASTRRALLAGSLGAFVAYAAHAFGRPQSARATDGDVIHVGDELSATSVTKITNTDPANTAAVIEAESYAGIGVSGVSAEAAGVRGASSFGPGVSGIGDVGVAGFSDFGTGVDGSSTDNIGVHGSSSAEDGAGVFGESFISVGVIGSSSIGTGVLARAGRGTALRVDGKATFSRSGRLTLAAGQSSIAKTSVTLSRYSMVLALLQTNRPGIYVRAVVPSPSTSSFRVYLNTAVPGTTYVAWFVLN